MIRIERRALHRVATFLVAAWAVLALGRAPRAAVGGPDALGTTWSDGDDGCPTELPVFGPSVQTWRDPTAPIGPLPLGFPMPFAGRVVTQVWISPSGFVAFSDQGAAGASTTTQLLPDALPPNDLVAAYWKADFAVQVDAEAFPDRFLVDWRRDEGAPFPSPAYLTLHRDGRMEMTWTNGRFGGLDVTLGYEDAAGGLGTTYWRDGAAIQPGVQQPRFGRSLCLTPPILLDCSTPVPLACGDDVVLRLPSSLPQQAQAYTCSSDVYPGLELVARLDLAQPTHAIVSIDHPQCDLLLLERPPACAEGRCLAVRDQVLDLSPAFAGEHHLAIDKTTPGGGDSVRVVVSCSPLPTLDCGSSVAATTVGGPRQSDAYPCAGAVLDGPEASFLVTLSTTDRLALTLPGSAPGLWIVVRDSAGACIAAGAGGVALFGLAPGAYVVTVDGERGAEGAFTLQAACDVRVDCSRARTLACGARVAGDTSLAPFDRVDLSACSPRVLDGAEDAWIVDVPSELVVSARFLASQPGQEIVLLATCDESACVFGRDQGTCARLPAGRYVLLVDGPASSEGYYELELACERDSEPGVDLRMEAVDDSLVVTDCRTLAFSAPLGMRIVNDGRDAAVAPFDVIAFLDTNDSGRFEATDTTLGVATVTTDILPGEPRDLVVACSGTLPFREAPIHAQVDPFEVVPDGQRGNDASDSAGDCRGTGPRAPFGLRLEWEWTGSPLASTFMEVESVPLVADLDGDGHAEVLFCAQEPAGSPNTGCVLRAVDGRTGGDVWAADAPAARFRVATAQAIGDLDGDGSPEIVGQSHSDTSRLICLDAAGALKWTSAPLSVQSPFDTYSGAPAIADVDGDGSAEIAWGPNVLRADGTPFWLADAGGTLGSNSGGPISIVLDVDVPPDGVQEIVAGPTAYRFQPPARGAIAWTRADVPDGFAAAGNLDDDAGLEIVLASPYRLDVVDAESGATKWTTELPAGGGFPCGGMAGTAGGPPTLADVDSDGSVDVVVVVADWLACFDRDGALKWKAPVAECSSGVTSATVFDLDGDGRAEVIHKDEQALRVLAGEDGAELDSVPGTSGTAREMPVVADVDGDGSAEILVAENRLLGGSGVGLAGVRCFGSARAPWAGARATWNQHAYHATNVESDLSIPAGTSVACRPPSPLASGTFRVQRPRPNEGPFLPDLTATILSIDQVAVVGCDQTVEVVVRIGNAGRMEARSSPTSFWRGDPAAGGMLMDVAFTGGLLPSRHVDLTSRMQVPLGAPFEIHVRADFDGGGQVVVECREDNGACVVTDADVGGTPPAPPADVGPALRATGHGDPYAADVTARFEWTLDAGAPRPLGTGPTDEHYHVLRGPLGPRPPILAPIPGSEPWLVPAWDDSTPQTPDALLPHVFGYLIRAASACELESSD